MTLPPSLSSLLAMLMSKVTYYHKVPYFTNHSSTTAVGCTSVARGQWPRSSGPLSQGSVIMWALVMSNVVGLQGWSIAITPNEFWQLNSKGRWYERGQLFPHLFSLWLDSAPVKWGPQCRGNLPRPVRMVQERHYFTKILLICHLLCLFLHHLLIVLKGLG